MPHLSDDDLERYLLRGLRDEAAVAAIEEHLLACPACVERAEAMADHIAGMKEALRQMQADDEDGVQ